MPPWSSCTSGIDACGDGSRLAGGSCWCWFLPTAGSKPCFFATGETRDPTTGCALRRWGYALALVTVIYTLVQGGDQRHARESGGDGNVPLADAARHIFGGGAAAAIAGGALVSIYGYLGANMLHTPAIDVRAGGARKIFRVSLPRCTQNFVLRMFPSCSIPLCCWRFTLLGNFRWNITLFRSGEAADVFLFWPWRSWCCAASSRRLTHFRRARRKYDCDSYAGIFVRCCSHRRRRATCRSF